MKMSPYTYRAILLLLIPWMTFASWAQNPQWAWAIDYGTSAWEFARQVAVDTVAHHVYVVGNWEDDLSATFPGGVNPSTQFNTSYGWMDGFVAKYDQGGNLLWAFKVGGENDDQVNSIAIDQGGDIYITGVMDEGTSIYFSGTSPHTGSSTLSNSSNEDFFLAKYNSDGEFLWVRRSTTNSGNLKGTDVTLTSDAVYAVGTYDDWATFGPLPTANTPGDNDIFLVKYNLDGDIQWIAEAGSDGDDQVHGVVADASGVYYIGHFNGETLDIRQSDGGSGSAEDNDDDEGYYDIIVVDYHPSGNIDWSETIASYDDDEGYGITQDTDSLYITGAIENNADFPGYSGNPLSTSSRQDIFIASLAKTDGTTGWVQVLPCTSSGNELGRRVDMDASGNLYVTGDYSGDLQFPGGVTLSALGQEDVFVSAFTSGGSFQWAESAGSSSMDIGYGLAVGPVGSLYVAGRHDGEMTLGSLTLPNNPGMNGYLAKLQDTILPIPFADPGLYGDVCGSTLGLQAILSSGVGVWSQLSGPGSATFTPAENDPMVSVEVDQYGAYTFAWTETNISGSDDSIFIVEFFEPTLANAGSGGDTCSLDFNLNASPSAGLGQWTLVTGPGTVTFLPSDTVPDAVASVSQIGIYTFQWTETNGICSSSSAIVVIFFEMPVSNAGAGGDICGLDFQLSAAPSIGIGIWTMTAGPGTATFNPSINTPDAIALVDMPGSYQFTWTEISGVCTSTDSVTVNYFAPSPVDPGNGGPVCGLTFDLNAIPSFGTGSWSLQSGPGTAIFSPSMNDADASVTVPVPGDYVFLWTESDGICSNDSAINVTFIEIPVAQAGTGGDICGPDYQLSAVPSIGTGIWTMTGGPGTASFNPSADVPNAMVSVDMPGTYQFTWTETNGICVDQASIDVNFLNNLVVDLGPDATACGLQHGLNVNPPDIPGSWSTVYGPGNASFSPSETDPAARVSVDAYGAYLFRWDARQGFCTGEDSVLVSFHREPVANAGPDQVLDFRFSTYLEASLLSVDVAAVNAAGSWNLVSGSGLIANPRDPGTLVSDLQLGANVFQWTISSDFCPDVLDQVIITVNDVESYTVITPNNDGLNDMLVFPGVEELSGCEIIIYNRWGIEVYRNADYQNNWDGRDHNDRELIADTYYYILRIPPDRIIKSFVEIRRSQR